jgi:hypothetical protein
VENVGGIDMLGNYPKECTQQSEKVESLKLRNLNVLIYMKMEKQA